MASHGHSKERVKQPQNLTVQFLAHSRPFKGYIVFTYFIKNQSVGVPRDALYDLFWNFEYLTSGLFHRLSTANFSTKTPGFTHRLQ